MRRTGKIAGLSEETREELNRRLEDNEDGPALLKWLNGLPETRESLKSSFNGVPISKQNLSEWRNGGYREWLIHAELHQCGFDACQEVRFMEEEFDVSLLAGALAAKVSLRYAMLLAKWDGLPNKKIETQLRILRTMARDIDLLQRTMQRATDHKEAVSQTRQEELRQATLDLMMPDFCKPHSGGQTKSKSVKPVRPVKASKLKSAKTVADEHVKTTSAPPGQPNPVKETKPLQPFPQEPAEMSHAPVTETIDMPPGV